MMVFWPVPKSVIFEVLPWLFRIFKLGLFVSWLCWRHCLKMYIPRWHTNKPPGDEKWVIWALLTKSYNKTPWINKNLPVGSFLFVLGQRFFTASNLTSFLNLSNTKWNSKRDHREDFVCPGTNKNLPVVPRRGFCLSWDKQKPPGGISLIYTTR